jgi:hypothetical protein
MPVWTGPEAIGNQPALKETRSDEKGRCEEGGHKNRPTQRMFDQIIGR